MYREPLRDLIDWSYKYLTEPFGVSALIPAVIVACYITITHQMYYKRLKIERRILYIIPIFKITSKGVKRIPLTLTLIGLHVMFFFALWTQLIETFKIEDIGNNAVIEFNRRFNLSVLILWWLPLQFYLPIFLYHELGIGKRNQYNRKIYIRDPLYVKMFVMYYLIVNGVYFYNQYWVIMENIYGVKSEMYFLNWFENTIIGIFNFFGI